MGRTFKTVDYAATLEQPVRLGECLPPDHLARFIADVLSTRKIERATYESAPFRYLAGNLHPDHDTLATFRKTFLPNLQELFVQVLLLAQASGVVRLGTISLDGTKIHAHCAGR